VSQRRRVQELHERFTVNLFLKEFNFRYHTDFKVIEEPNPPEAIVQSKNSTRWVEVTTAYLDAEYAADLNSYATKGEKHVPRRRQELSIDTDEQFAKQFVRVVKNKLEKSTYEPSFRKHGKGYLVVSIKYPLFGKETLRLIEHVWDQAQALDKGFFKSIYITYPVFNEYRVSLWKSNLI
jgi:hypothetical protein